MLDKEDTSQALYLQLTNYFRDRILDGRIPAGTCLPKEVDIAREQQISRGTVRQAMTALVNEGLLERVKGQGTFVRMQSEMGTGKEGPAFSKHIGIILDGPPLEAQLNIELLMGVEQAAKARGYKVSFTSSGHSLEQQEHDIERMQRDQVAGLIILPVYDVNSCEGIAQLQKAGIPVVLIDRYLPGLLTDYVGADNTSGGYRATEHLIILGHQRIGFAHFAAGTLKSSSIHDRWQGYRNALEAYQIPYHEKLVFFDPSGGQKQDASTCYDAVFSLPERERPTAVFTVHDEDAMKLLQAARRWNIRVPEDLAIVGFDNLRFAAHLSTPLTTIAQPLTEIGEHTGNLLINRIEGLPGPPKRIELPTTLIVRESCGAKLHVRKMMIEGNNSVSPSSPIS